MQFQRRLSNGSWVDEDRIEMFTAMVLEREPWFAPRVNREPMTTHEQVMTYLRSGKTINYESDWYAEIRDADAMPKRRRPAPPVETLCACGHYSAHPMRASRGTSCPDCYDRMSD